MLDPLSVLQVHQLRPGLSFCVSFFITRATIERHGRLVRRNALRKRLLLSLRPMALAPSRSRPGRPGVTAEEDSVTSGRWVVEGASWTVTTRSDEVSRERGTRELAVPLTEAARGDLMTGCSSPASVAADLDV